MWLSKKAAVLNEQDSSQIGKVTIAGSDLGIYAGSERRRVRLFSPKGFVWKPERGQELLVMELKDGTAAALGAAVDTPPGMSAGEVYIKSKGGAEIRLKNDGGVTISGDVNVEGSFSINGVPVA